VILSPSRAVRVFAFPAPVDLRNCYNGLFGLVQNTLHTDPMGGDLFLFVNTRRCWPPDPHAGESRPLPYTGAPAREGSLRCRVARSRALAS
jgi:hypothetical protein